MRTYTSKVYPLQFTSHYKLVCRLFQIKSELAVLAVSTLRQAITILSWGGKLNELLSQETTNWGVNDKGAAAAGGLYGSVGWCTVEGLCCQQTSRRPIMMTSCWASPRASRRVVKWAPFKGRIDHSRYDYTGRTSFTPQIKQSVGLANLIYYFSCFF